MTIEVNFRGFGVREVSIVPMRQSKKSKKCREPRKYKTENEAGAVMANPARESNGEFLRLDFDRRA
jgi:hypothetical protein